VKFHFTHLKHKNNIFFAKDLTGKCQISKFLPPSDAHGNSWKYEQTS